MHNSRNLLKVVKEGGMAVLTKRTDSYGLTFIESPVFEGLPTTKKVVIEEADGLSDVRIRRDLSHVAGLLFVEDGVASSNRIIEGGDAYLFVKRYVHKGISLYVKEGGEAAMRIGRKTINKINEKENRFKKFSKLTAKEIIKSSKQFKSKVQYNVLNLALNDDGEVVAKVPVAFGDNNISKIRGAKDTPVSTFVGDVVNTRTIKNFINSVFYITVNGDIMEKIKDSKNVFISKNKDELIIEGLDGFYSYKKKEFVEKKASWIQIHPACYTTTSMKKKMVMFVKTDANHTSWVDTVEEVIPGFLEELKKKCSYKENSRALRQKTGERYVMEISPKNAAKVFGRVSLGITGSVTLGEAAGIAVACTTFIPETNGKSASDGAGFASDEVISEMFNITPVEARKVMLQARLREATCKAALQTRSRESIYEYIDELRAEGVEVVTFGDSDNIQFLIDENVVKIMGTDLFRNDFRFYNIAEVIKGNSSIQLLSKAAYAAANGNKLQDFEDYIFEKGSNEIREEVAAKLEEGEKDAKLGSQYYVDIIKQLNAKNPIVKRDKSREIQNGCKKKIAKVKFNFKGAFEFAALAPDAVASFTRADKELLSHNDEVIEVFYGNYASKVQKLKRYINKLVVKIEEAETLGINTVEDKALLIEKKRELIALRRKYRNAVIYKYPTPNQIEYIKVKCLESSEAIDRIDGMDISDSKKEELISVIKYYPEGSLMLPNDTNIMDLLAGSDFDFDEGCLCFDRKLNSFLKFNKETIELSKENGKKQQLLKLNKNLMTDVILMQLKADDGVGKVTKEFERILMLLIDMLNGGNNSKKAYTVALHFLFELVGSTKGKERDYVSPQKRVFGQEFVSLILKEIKEVKWTFENVRTFLLDCSFCGRFYQESIIDATKTGEFFVRLIGCVTIVLENSYAIDFDKEGLMFKKIDSKIAEKKIRKVFSLDENGNTLFNTKREVKYISYKDVFARIQDRLVEFYNKEIMSMIEESFSEYFYTDETVSTLRIAYSYIVNNGYQDIISKLNEIKGIYNNIIAKKIDLLNKAGDNDDAKKNINESFAIYDKALANNIKALFEYASKKDVFFSDKKNIGALLLGATIGNFDRKECVFKDFDSSSDKRFAYTVDFTATMVLLGGDETYRTYAEVLHDENRVAPGTAINLIRGIDEDAGIICESTYTGDAIYDEDECGAYLYKEYNISDAIKEESSSNLIVTIDSRNIVDGLTINFLKALNNPNTEIVLFDKSYKTAYDKATGVGIKLKTITVVDSKKKAEFNDMICRSVNGLADSSLFYGPNSKTLHRIKAVCVAEKESATYYNIVIEK